MNGSDSLRSALSDAYLRACRIDVECVKPGNVSLYAAGHDMTAKDFLRSARASCNPLCTPAHPLGERIYRAVAASRAAVGCNTNLGIILLAAPLLDAAMTARGTDIGAALDRTLARTTREDAAWVYRAIRLAAPGGLGTAASEDVSRVPGVTLVEAMAIAAERDRIAFQYSHRFSDILGFGASRFRDYRRRWGDEAWAAVAVYVGFAARVADTHLVRKFGYARADRVREEFARLEPRLAGATEPQSILRDLTVLDSRLKAERLNPGTSADLAVASVLYVLTNGELSGPADPWRVSRNESRPGQSRPLPAVAGP